MDTFGIGDAVKRKKKVYVETSVISYLTARDSHDVRLLARQITTRDWWNIRSRFELYISRAVLGEIRSGDEAAANQREAAVAGIIVLGNTPKSKAVAKHLISCGAVPPQAETDAAHIALASVHGMDFLITWNQAHITNPAKMEQINTAIREMGFTPPLLVKPDYFLEADYDN